MRISRPLLLVILAGSLLRCGGTEPLAPLPDTAPPVASAGLTFPIERTPERLERGRYIVEHVSHCFHCHSEVDWQGTGLPLEGRKGAGTPFPEHAFEWLIAPNITPDPETGAGNWTDEHLANAIRNGIGNDGRRLFPMMPYMSFRQMSDEDLASVITYIRSIPAVHNPLPKTVIPEPFQVMMPPDLPPVDSVPAADLSTPEKRGEYLVTLGDCAGCHMSFDENFAPREELGLSGGLMLNGPWGQATSYNLTPDPSGIPHYDEAVFLQTIRTGKVAGVRDLNPIMPWIHLRGQTDDDLKAIFAYLKTLPPIQHRIDNTAPIAACKICESEHHGGALND